MNERELMLKIELDELRLKIALKKFTKIRKYEERWTGQHDTEEWGETRDNIPDWPRDIAAAFTLLDAVEAAGLRWMLHTLADGQKNCAIYQPEVIEGRPCAKPLAEAQGETAALAISRAFAEWMEGAKEKAK